MNEDWLRVFHHELARRRRISAENKELFQKLTAVNPKGLVLEKDCQRHCWVPATHLMIHDGAGRNYKIGGLNRRAFIEAKTYRRDLDQIVPQMCWTCDATREYVLVLLTAEKRLALLKAGRPRKARGRRPEPIKSVFDQLFDEE